ncbi:hypothetical protein TNCV_2051451 [Trichonephila clavipes]|nr:hypothetical protein TNCV_2051451 [Trichonephila clavipes]
MVLKANDRRASCHDEFRGARSDYVRQSKFLVRGTTSYVGVDVLASRAAHVMGAMILNVLHPRAFVWFEKTPSP